MITNLYMATEILQKAYEDIDESHNLIEVDGVEVFRVPNRTEFYAETLGFPEPTLTQKLLAYYGSKDEVFNSKKIAGQEQVIVDSKFDATVNYILDGVINSLDDSRKSTKKPIDTTSQNSLEPEQENNK